MKRLHWHILLLLPLLAACAPPAPSDAERLSLLSAECQSEASSGAVPVEKSSDVSGSGHFLLDTPSESGRKKVNQKATRILGETHYVSIDYSTRVFVECFIPGKDYAYVRVEQPSHLIEHRGWVPSSVLTIRLSSSSQSTSNNKTKDSYVVVGDTRGKYEEQSVQFTQKTPAICGTAGRRGVRGSGTLKVFTPPETMQVEVFPCSDEDLIHIKLPDGRVLDLRKSI